MKKGKVVTVANQKGGVTKTNTCRYLADVYAESGKKVLMIDLDPQASLTKGYKIDEHLLTGVNEGNICNIFYGKEVNILSLSEDFYKEIHLLPSNKDLAAVAENSIVGKELKLKKYIENNNLKDYYDVIIIDNNPNFGSLTINSILAADIFVVPVGTTKDDQEGMHGFFDKTEETLSAYDHHVEKIVCIPSRHNKITKVSKIYLDIIKNDMEPYIKNNCPILSHASYEITPPVPESVAFQEASAYSMSCYKYLLEYGSTYSSMKKPAREDLISKMKKIAKKVLKQN